MSKIRIGLATLAVALLAGFLRLVQPASAKESTAITISVKSVFARRAPDWEATRTASLFRGDTFAITGRNADATWVQIIVPGIREQTWVSVSVGQVKGDLSGIPVISDGTNGKTTPPSTAPLDTVAPNTVSHQPSAAPSRPPDWVFATFGNTVQYPAWIPAITPGMRQIYRESVLHDRDPHMFTVVGDSNALEALDLNRVTARGIDLDKYGLLREMRDRFAWSFSRGSLAAIRCLTTASAVDPAWADPRRCLEGEGPYQCELRVSRASIVFIALGTCDQYYWWEFDGRFAHLIEYALAQGALPVVVTKVDDVEQARGAPPDYLNTVMRQMAADYGVPLLDFWLAARQLPNQGLAGTDEYHLGDFGRDLRLVTMLQTLEALSQQ